MAVRSSASCSPPCSLLLAATSFCSCGGAGHIWSYISAKVSSLGDSIVARSACMGGWGV